MSLWIVAIWRRYKVTVDFLYRKKYFRSEGCMRVPLITLRRTLVFDCPSRWRQPTYDLSHVEYLCEITRCTLHLGSNTTLLFLSFQSLLLLQLCETESIALTRTKVHGDYAAVLFSIIRGLTLIDINQT